MDLNQLHQAYERFFGEPDEVLRLSAGDEGLSPHRLDIAYDYAKPSEGKVETTLTTLGLATHPMGGACERVELVASVLGLPTPEERERLGRGLAHLIWDQVRENRAFAPNGILHNVSLPLFERMHHLFVLDWGHTEPEWLEGVDPPVRLLEVVPIHEREAAELAGVDEAVRTTVFVQARGAWGDPGREPVPLVAGAVGSVWQRLEAWYAERAPAAGEALNAGASREEVEALQEQLGVVLPADLAASLRRHDGAVTFHDSYRYLATDRILAVWSMMKALEEQGAFSTYEPKASVKGIIQYTWWDTHWIPFAEDSQGNLICVDLKPGRAGKHGQVIYWERVEGPLSSPYGSFFEWLWRYQRALYRGAYVARDGGIYERSAAEG